MDGGLVEGAIGEVLLNMARAEQELLSIDTCPGYIDEERRRRYAYATEMIRNYLQLALLSAEKLIAERIRMPEGDQFEL